MATTGAKNNPPNPNSFNPAYMAVIVIIGCRPIWWPTILGSKTFLTTVTITYKINNPNPIK